MTSKSRVMTAINHKEPDRIPCTFKGTPEVENQLVKYFGLKDTEGLKHILYVDNFHWPWRTISPRNHNKMQKLSDEQTKDMWGVVRKKMDYGLGIYEEVVYSPLAFATSVEEIENYTWPRVEELDFSNIYQDSLANKDYALAGGNWNIFEPANAIRGFQKFLLDLALNEDIAFAIIHKIEEFWWHYNERMMQEIKGLLDIFPTGDDFGSQTGLLMSLEMWKKYFVPGMKRAYAFAHQHGLKVVMHCDGAIKQLLPELIDMGLDLIDPLQPKAKDMNPYHIHKEFGQQLCFHGTIDVQELLPFGNPQEIRDEVKRQIDSLAPGGGFFLAPSHCIQPGVPIENIITMYETAKKYGRY